MSSLEKSQNNNEDSKISQTEAWTTFEAISKEKWAEAIKVWNEIFPEEKQYDPEKDIDQPYLAKDYITADGKNAVWARLYQDGGNPADFILVANGGDPMALLEIAQKLLDKGVHIIRIKSGNGMFRPGESQGMLDSKLESLKSNKN